MKSKGGLYIAVLAFFSCLSLSAQEKMAVPTFESMKAAIAAKKPLLDMVRVTGGTFLMGENPAEGKTGHQVTVSDFYIAKTETVFALVDLQRDETWQGRNSDGGGSRGLRPARNINWYDAAEFANWLSNLQGLTPAYKIDRNKKDPHNLNDLDGGKYLVLLNPKANGYRLPTEAEWEYAARGLGVSSTAVAEDLAPIQFAGSDQIDDVAWYDSSVPGQPDPVYNTRVVASKKPNNLGIYDMSGNVAEWCWDWKGPYLTTPQTNPLGPDQGTERVVRGGAYSTKPYQCTITYRDIYDTNPMGMNDHTGFRLVRNLR